MTSRSVNKHPTAIVVDDETGGRVAIRELLAVVSPHVHVIGEASSVASAVQLLSACSPDMMFLDIKLGDGTGFDILDKTQAAPYIIFVSAFDQFAIQALRLSAIDYLLKPVDPKELKAAVSRVEEVMYEQDNLLTQFSIDQAEKLDLLSKILLQSNVQAQRIALPISNGYRFVDFASIVQCEADSNYTHVHLDNGEKLLITRTLGDIESVLPSTQFIRIHQSHLVNSSLIERYVRGNGGYVVLKNGTTVEVSNRKKRQLTDFIKSNSPRS